MTPEDKEIIKELIDIIETDLLNGNGSSVLTRLGKLKEKLEPKKYQSRKNCI